MMLSDVCHSVCRSVLAFQLIQFFSCGRRFRYFLFSASIIRRRRNRRSRRLLLRRRPALRSQPSSGGGRDGGEGKTSISFSSSAIRHSRHSAGHQTVRDWRAHPAARPVQRIAAPHPAGNTDQCSGLYKPHAPRGELRLAPPPVNSGSTLSALWKLKSTRGVDPGAGVMTP